MTAGVDNSGSVRNPALSSTGMVSLQEEISLAVHAFLAADKQARNGNETAAKERTQHLRKIQARFWRMFDSILSSRLSRRHHGALEFPDEERLFIDFGLVDARMLGGDRAETVRRLMNETSGSALADCYYLSEWLNHRLQQMQLENSLGSGMPEPEDATSKLAETRKRVLDRLSEQLVGLPGVPLEVSESLRSGKLDNAILAANMALLDAPRRRVFLRRHQLWQLREQILAKARARASGGEAALKLFDLLNEIYVRDWRERYETHNAGPLLDPEAGAKSAQDTATVGDANHEALMDEARQVRRRIILERAMDGETKPDMILHNEDAPRLTKSAIAGALPLFQTFDRALAALPPILIVPGQGRGFFAWEAGCVTLSIRPIVGTEDSVATAFAWLRMIDDLLNRNGALRLAYEAAFPGATFRLDFPADYRAWFCRLAKGDAAAMSGERRAFFRDHIGPDLSRPLLPPNLRDIGPLTAAAICRRLERQLASGDADANIHRRLAALYWSQGNMEAAGMQFVTAMRLAPNDGEIFFSAGMFLRAKGAGNAAAECFRSGAERAVDSLWGLYCRDAQANLL